MKIQFLLLVEGRAMMKTFESPIRPVAGDIVHDPGFDLNYHNGYEVVKVTINYAADECWVSLSPLAIELTGLGAESYVKKLEAHGWRSVPREEMLRS